MPIKQTPLLLVLVSLFLSLQVQADIVNVEINKFKFIPQQLIVEVGDTVIWTNKEKRQYHSVWFKTLTAIEPDYFFPEETYQRTFNEVGTFNYECGPHPKMKGLIVVKQSR